MKQKRFLTVSLIVSFFTVFIILFFSYHFFSAKEELHPGMNKPGGIIRNENSMSFSGEKERAEQLDSISYKEEMNMQEVNSNSNFLHVYYVVSKNDIVEIYMDNMDQLFQTTQISIFSLPKEVQEQIKNVMIITDEKELYDFLENYTS